MARTFRNVTCTCCGNVYKDYKGDRIECHGFNFFYKKKDGTEGHLTRCVKCQAVLVVFDDEITGTPFSELKDKNSITTESFYNS